MQFIDLIANLLTLHVSGMPIMNPRIQRKNRMRSSTRLSFSPSWYITDEAIISSLQKGKVVPTITGIVQSRAGWRGAYFILRTGQGNTQKQGNILNILEFGATSLRYRSPSKLGINRRQHQHSEEERGPQRAECHERCDTRVDGEGQVRGIVFCKDQVYNGLRKI